MHPSKNGFSSISDIVVLFTSLKSSQDAWVEMALALWLPWHWQRQQTLFFPHKFQNWQLRIAPFRQLLLFFRGWHPFIRLMWVYLILFQSCVMPHASRQLDDDAKFFVFITWRDERDQTTRQVKIFKCITATPSWWRPLFAFSRYQVNGKSFKTTLLPVVRRVAECTKKKMTCVPLIRALNRKCVRRAVWRTQLSNDRM